MICALDAPLTYMPPPFWPLQPGCFVLPSIALSRMTGDANATEMPTPLAHDVFATMLLPATVGEAPLMWTPAPS